MLQIVVRGASARRCGALDRRSQCFRSPDCRDALDRRLRRFRSPDRRRGASEAKIAVAAL